MAGVDLETLTANVEVSPYTGLTAIQRQQSGIARAQVSLVWPQTTLAGTASGNIKGVSLQGSLPRNFAYVYYGGSIAIARVAAADVLDQNSGCYFENTINCAIQESTGKSDVWTMQVSGVTKQELDNNIKYDPGVGSAHESGSSATTSNDTHFATPGVYDPYSDLYKKTYNDSHPPSIIYRGTEGDIDVFASVAELVNNPFPASQYIILGRMHFIQYDIDQAYNYAIHSPIPVR